MPKEIERKYRLLSCPSSEVLGRAIPTVQGYVVCEPGELRLRRQGERYFLTVKGQGGLVRDEWEVAIEPWVFEVLWPSTSGRRIEKRRYRVADGGRQLEIDVFAGDLAGLITLECEFRTPEDAAAFVVPEWAGPAVEVTTDDRYKNRNLALTGLPRD